MSTASESVIALFGSAAVAETAARRVMAWTESNSLARVEALGVLAKGGNGRVSMRKLGPRETRKGAAIGLLAGALSAFASDELTLLQGLAVGAASGGVVGSLFRKDLRLRAETRSRIASRLSPGGAAVLAIVPVRQAAVVTEKLMEYGGAPDAGTASEPARVAEPVPSPG